MAIPPDQRPDPGELIRRFEAGILPRDEFQKLMATHARDLLQEVEEARLNPMLSYLEQVRNRAAAARLRHRHGEPLVREILVALCAWPDFPHPSLLWNASHTEVPLFCFIRTRHAPVLRILDIRQDAAGVHVHLHFSQPGQRQLRRERLHLFRTADGKLSVVP